MSDTLSLEQARKRLYVSMRKMAYLLRTGSIHAVLEHGRLRVPPEELDTAWREFDGGTFVRHGPGPTSTQERPWA
jgi:hypothetical protein